MKGFARVQSIEITNFKNVSYGKIDFSDYGKDNSNYQQNITAVYGQNGSGKTALIDAIYLVQRVVLSREDIPEDIGNYIKKGADEATIAVQFFFANSNEISIVNYKIALRTVHNETIIVEEQVKAKECLNGAWGNLSEVIRYDSRTTPYTISPKYLYDKLTVTTDMALDLGVAQRLSQKRGSKTSSVSSLLFSRDFRELLDKAETESRLGIILKKIQEFCVNNLLIINDEVFGAISENQHAIPIFVKQEFRNNSSYNTAIGAIPIEIYDTTRVPSRLFYIYINFVRQINAVLPEIIPGITLKITNPVEESLPNGEKYTVFSVVTVRGEKEISLKYESAGIKKILCVLSSLIAAFNNSDMCFIVDELDSGVFEYLLGQIVTVFKEDAKGQLIFTSHNLHILELLDNKSIVITRYNTDNCYGKLTNVQTNNNKRLLYLRHIELEDEADGIIYNKTNQYEMSFAFEQAYDIFEKEDVSE
ncbi:MAG: AAA family ATPase [Clostridia bacterium]|nr:AAA family ATPase [Clostridia bacterium]